jgi:adenylate cyclase class 2
MSLEIEMKARVADPAGLELRLREQMEFVRAFHKKDEYFHFPEALGVDPLQNVRVRQDGGAAVITWKERRRLGALEMNQEREFEVSSAQAFVELIQAMGAKPYFCKEKRGLEFSRDGLCLELCEVPPLGWFLEIERVIESAPGAAEAQSLEAQSLVAKKEIAGIFSSLGIAESALETLSYSELLRQYSGQGESQ